jgi:hypothetical protein
MYVDASDEIWNVRDGPRTRQNEIVSLLTG